MVGLGGSKDKGIEYLYEVAHSNGENSVDAQDCSSVLFRREHRFSEALTILHTLIPQYPQNALFALEEGNLFERMDAILRMQPTSIAGSGRPAEMANYPGLHYELAALHLGDLLRSQKDYAGASLAYELVAQAPQPDPRPCRRRIWPLAKCTICSKNATWRPRRYEAVIAMNGSTAPADIARRHLKEPYRAN